MRHTLALLLVLSALIGATGCRQTEKTEGITAQIEAAQMEGRNAARTMLNRQWADSTERDRDMAVIDSLRRAYPDTAAGSAFYRTFRSTLRSVRPDLYRQLK